MGIQGLNQFLKDKFPDLHQSVHLSNYRYKKMAIDTSLYMYKFKTVYGEYDWLISFVNLVICLRKNDIHCVFIYDTKAPVEKMSEQADRRKLKEKIDVTRQSLEDDLSNYLQTGIVTENLKQVNIKSAPKRLLNTKETINVDSINIEIEKLKKQTIKITPQDFELTRQLFDIMNIPYLFAPSEAEKLCSHLCKQGLVDAVLSEDSDVIAYGAPIFLSKINMQTSLCTELVYSDILTSVDMTSEQFLDFCIMCGTDYNKNIPKVGPVSSFNLIKKHKSIDNITGYDTCILNHVRTRELFTVYEEIDITSIPYCKPPDYDKLYDFFSVNKLFINMDKLREAFTPILEFKDD